MFTTKERILVSLIGLAALALGFTLLLLPFLAWEYYGQESWQFISSLLVALFATSAISAGV